MRTHRIRFDKIPQLYIYFSLKELAQNRTEWKRPVHDVMDVDGDDIPVSIFTMFDHKVSATICKKHTQILTFLSSYPPL